MRHFTLSCWISAHLLLLCTPVSAQSQSNDGPIKHIIASKVFGADREVDVFLPAAYFGDDSTRSFVTAYVFDAQFEPYFTMVSSIMSYYAQSGEGIPMIVVGIHTNNRWDEFVPAESNGDTAKGADRLSEFLRKEVIPLIDAKYRTKRFRVGVGHSLGATFVIHEMTKDDALFQAGIIASPNLNVNDDRMVREARDYFLRDPGNNRSFYVLAGTVGHTENAFRGNLLRLDSIATGLHLPNMYWHCTVGAGLDHMRTFIPCFNTGYLALSAKLQLRDEDLMQMAADSTTSLVDALAKFHADVGKFLGGSQLFGASEAMDHAFTLVQYGEYDQALNLYAYAEQVLGQDTLEGELKQNVMDRLHNGRIWATFNAIASRAKAKADALDYPEASRLYKEAFATGAFRATHIARIASVPVFAQTNETEEAFTQLELLADTFKLGGNEDFINDKRCEPLHNDPRWAQLMDKLARNAELYK
jgi:predicted alpha/beta superfamily hydrolase